MKKRSSLVFLFLLVIFASFALAQGGEEISAHAEYAKQQAMVWKVVSLGAVVVILFGVIATCFGPKMSEWQKKSLFSIVATVAILVTAFLVIGTVTHNITSETKGPVHWHADFEIWDCGNRIDLIDPKGLSNKVGTPVFHEHNDFRIHVEGVVKKMEDISLANFFAVLGGQMSESSLKFPSTAGEIEMKNGEECNGEQGVLQVYALKIENPSEHNKWRYTQTKVSDIEGYVLSPYATVPPADCIIIEFGPMKEKTERICETYKISKEKGYLDGS